MRVLMAFIYWLRGLKRRSVTVDNFKIVYIEKGRGPAIVLLHGLGASKDAFLAVAPRLAKHFRVLVPDLPGFGESDRPEHESYLVGDQIARVNGFIEQLGLDRVSIGGNSMGGLIAGAYASAYPDRIESVLLLAPAGVKSARPSRLMQSLEAGEPAAILARTVDDVRNLLKFTMHRPPYMPGFMLKAMADEQAERYSHHDRIMRGMFADKGLDEILHHAPVKAPTLIVWGQQDQALDVSGAGILHRLIENSQIVLMDEMGHLPQMEAPDRVVSDYVAFRKGAGLD